MKFEELAGRSFDGIRRRPWGGTGETFQLFHARLQPGAFGRMDAFDLGEPLFQSLRFGLQFAALRGPLLLRGGSPGEFVPLPSIVQLGQRAGRVLFILLQTRLKFSFELA